MGDEKVPEETDYAVVLSSLLPLSNCLLLSERLNSVDFEQREHWRPTLFFRFLFIVSRLARKSKMVCTMNQIQFWKSRKVRAVDSCHSDIGEDHVNFIKASQPMKR